MLHSAQANGKEITINNSCTVSILKQEKTVRGSKKNFIFLDCPSYLALEPVPLESGQAGALVGPVGVCAPGGGRVAVVEAQGAFVVVNAVRRGRSGVVVSHWLRQGQGETLVAQAAERAQGVLALAVPGNKFLVGITIRGRK